MKVALVRQQLRGGDVLDGDGVVRGVRDDGVAVSVMGCCEDGGHASEDRLADLDGVFCRVEIRNGDLAKFRREHERIVTRCHGQVRWAGASDLSGRIADYPALLIRRALCW